MLFITVQHQEHTKPQIQLLIYEKMLNCNNASI